MDDLAENLAASFNVSAESGYSTAAEHPRFSSYKNRNQAALNQEKRRWEYLEKQKQSRFDQVMLARKLAMDEFDEGDLSPMEDEATPTDATVNKRGNHRNNIDRRRFYKDRLMLSEWLVDIPEASQLDADWLMLPCPEGRRCLVVAAKGVTTVYSKAGWKMNQFPSLLPGGRGGHRNEDYTLLDCVFSQLDSTFFVLDIMCWHNYPVFETETEFRFFWLQSRLAELPDLMEKSKANPYRFVCLQSCACTKDAMQSLMTQEFSFKSKLDGLLFYHKQAHYWSGRTPLVGWLKPFMLPEILGVSVPQKYMEGHETENAAQFIEQFNQEQIEKKKSHSTAMDTSSSSTKAPE